jgi:hypothetical protein
MSDFPKTVEEVREQNKELFARIDEFPEGYYSIIYQDGLLTGLFVGLHVGENNQVDTLSFVVWLKDELEGKVKKYLLHGISPLLVTYVGKEKT